MWIIKIIKIKCFYPPRIPDEHWCIYSCLQIPPRENWFQYVYTTAINFPCITTLPLVPLWIGLTLKWGFSVLIINLIYQKRFSENRKIFKSKLEVASKNSNKHAFVYSMKKKWFDLNLMKNIFRLTNVFNS